MLLYTDDTLISWFSFSWKYICLGLDSDFSLLCVGCSQLVILFTVVTLTVTDMWNLLWCETGSSKATRVFSSAKYPSSDHSSDYCSVFADIPTDLQYPASSKYIVHSKHPCPDDKVLCYVLHAVYISVDWSVFLASCHSFMHYMLCILSTL